MNILRKVKMDKEFTTTHNNYNHSYNLIEKQTSLKNKHKELIKQHNFQMDQMRNILFKISALNTNDSIAEDKKLIVQLKNLSSQNWDCRVDFNVYMQLNYVENSPQNEKIEALNNCQKSLDNFKETLGMEKKLLDKFTDRLHEKEKNVSCGKKKRLIEKTNQLLDKSNILLERSIKLYMRSQRSPCRKIKEMGQNFDDSYNDHIATRDLICRELSDKFEFLYSQTNVTDQRTDTMDFFEKKLGSWEKKANKMEKLINKFKANLSKALKEMEYDGNEEIEHDDVMYC